MFFGVLNLTYHSPITIDSLTYRLGGDLYVSVLVRGCAPVRLASRSLTFCSNLTTVSPSRSVNVMVTVVSVGHSGS